MEEAKPLVVDPAGSAESRSAPSDTSSVSLASHTPPPSPSRNSRDELPAATKVGAGSAAPAPIVDEDRSKTSHLRAQSLRGSRSRFTANLVSYSSPDDEPPRGCDDDDRYVAAQEEYREKCAVLQRARRLVYVSHFFAQFSEVAWQFSLILFLAAITNYQSLVLVSTYGLVSGLSVCLFGSTAGRYVDGTNRLVAAQFFIWTENICVLIATAFCYRLLQGRNQEEEEPPTLLADDASSPASDPPSSWPSSMLPHVPMDHLSIFCLLGIHIFGPVAQILDRGFLVAIERDWIVIMSDSAVEEPEQQQQPSSSNSLDGSPPPELESEPDVRQRHAATKKAWLSETNITMKQIDLSCKVVAPAIAGFIIGAFDSQGPDKSDDVSAALSGGDPSLSQHSGSNLTGAAVLVGIVNVAALVAEYVCTLLVYRMIPALAVKQEGDNQSQLDRLASDESSSSSSQHGLLQMAAMSSPLPRGMAGGSGVEHWAIMQKPWRVPPALQIYLDQPVSKAGLALALLYLNALTFGALMTAYLLWRGMKLETVGIWRGISAAIGLAGTFVYYCSVRRMTIAQTGMWSIAVQMAFISVSFGALFITNYRTSMALLILGVCASRIGLWTFDIAVTQLFQEHIPEGIRGVVGGTQQALNAFFQLLSYALGLVFSDPKDFHVYVAAGYAAVVIGCLLYFIGVYLKAADFATPSHD